MNQWLKPRYTFDRSRPDFSSQSNPTAISPFNESNECGQTKAFCNVHTRIVTRGTTTWNHSSSYFTADNSCAPPIDASGDSYNLFYSIQYRDGCFSGATESCSSPGRIQNSRPFVNASFAAHGMPIFHPRCPSSSRNQVLDLFSPYIYRAISVRFHRERVPVAVLYCTHIVELVTRCTGGAFYQRTIILTNMSLRRITEKRSGRSVVDG